MTQSFDPQKLDYPVIHILAELRQALAHNSAAILSAAPGAGKSTVVPLAMMNEPWLAGKKIVMLEPRRLAAGAIAARMADLLGEAPGDRVGYRIRFDNKISASTRIEVVTEGILTRMLHDDSTLAGVGLVIFDEFHERNLNADLALALCLEVQSVLRSDLRILIMSATLDMPALASRLRAPVINSEGRMFPVRVIYTNEQDEFRIPELLRDTVLRALRETSGDILAFLPGEAEIARAADLLSSLEGQISLHPLFGRLSLAQQQAAIRPSSSGKRKLVLATAIAETSLTIEGVEVVIDTGFRRSPSFDQQSGISTLKTMQISMDSADQRMGRAGRIKEGVCYRMWSLATQERMKAFRTPEIADADLCSLYLDLAVWGTSDPSELIWLLPPPESAVLAAREVLDTVGAIYQGRVTAHGRAIHRLPCHPRIAHMLLMAADQELLPLACDVAALLEERDILDAQAGADFGARINNLRMMRQRGTLNLRLVYIEKVAASYRRMFRAAREDGAFDDFKVGLLIATAFPERIASARKGHDGQFLLANGKTAALDAADALAREPFIAVAQLDGRKGLGRIFLAAPINVEEIKAMASIQEVITWDVRKGGLQARKDLRIGSVIIGSEPLTVVPEEGRRAAIVKVLKDEGERLLSFDDDARQLQYRLSSLNSWRPELSLPDLSIAAVLGNAEHWFGPWFSSLKKNEDIGRLNLAGILWQGLDYEQQTILDKLVPTHLKVPSGSQIKLCYHADGAPPVLSVRLQEVFQLFDTPTINDGRNSVVLHLLSPGFKPVQVTSDLRSFWNNTYFEVRKELKRRYPKHSWPENPLEAEAVRGARRRQ